MMTFETFETLENISEYFPNSEETVEIHEREIVRVVKIRELPRDDEAVTAPLKFPTLVVEDEPVQAQTFLSKGRYDMSEVNAILKEVLGPHRPGGGH